MLKERVSKLLTVKSIVTVALTIVFCVLALNGIITGAEFLTIFTTVIAFYFGTQSTKESRTTLPDNPEGGAEDESKGE